MLLPFVLAGFGGYYRVRQFGNLDNKTPRKQSAALEGAGTRAVAAQQNAWEALAVFTAAVAVAHLAGADAGTAATASLVFVAARILHPIFYITNLDVLRSLSFVVGLGACITLFVSAARA